MRLLEHAAALAASNLALDEALLVRADSGASGASFRVWTVRAPAVVFGIGSRSSAECDVGECRSRGVELARRSSGGAAVMLEPGGLCASLVAPLAELAPEFRTIGGAHRLLGGMIVRALGELGVEAEFAGTSDVSVSDMKLAGLSQARKRRAILVHASVLVSPDMDIMESLLRHPPEEPAYRAGRPHREFLTSLDEVAGSGRRDEFARALAALSGARMNSEAPSQAELNLAYRLQVEKYSTEEWTLRR